MVSNRYVIWVHLKDRTEIREKPGQLPVFDFLAIKENQAFFSFAIPLNGNRLMLGGFPLLQYYKIQHVITIISKKIIDTQNKKSSIPICHKPVLLAASG